MQIFSSIFGLMSITMCKLAVLSNLRKNEHSLWNVVLIYAGTCIKPTTYGSVEHKYFLRKQFFVYV